jgi:hypothetical protein
MNERIKQLADQADLYARSDNSSMIFENYQKRYTEKFVEFLVQECITILDEDDGATHHTELLKQHFGVEE